MDDASTTTLEVRRLRHGDRDVARRLFTVMAEVFEETIGAPLGDAYLDALLGRADFWALAALVGGEVVGGLTAHALPMTRAESTELFIYDVAVRADRQRQGIGRHLIATLRRTAADAGIEELFVPADDEDGHALDFYRALGGVPAPVTIFTFSGRPR
ncbi:MAG: GNAT family N-acetyltransferase [Gemmatirosa sp.]